MRVEHLIEETENWKITYWSDGILDIRDKKDNEIGGIIMEATEADALLKFMNRVKAIIHFAEGMELNPADLILQARTSTPLQTSDETQESEK